MIIKYNNISMIKFPHKFKKENIIKSLNQILVNK